MLENLLISHIFNIALSKTTMPGLVLGLQIGFLKNFNYIVDLDGCNVLEVKSNNFI
jgi:hypothetical protein